VRQLLPKADLTVWSVQFLSDTEGWATAADFAPHTPVKFWFKSLLLHTVDGGETWKRVAAPNSSELYKGIHFSDPDNGWLWTDTGLYQTEDGGLSWSVSLEYPRPTYRID
ncbi:MAG TPA: hypothetical protein VJX67_10445, partial [Blastocatellia bacterium]|nr:hypothetical protein [Blastocatellia bacterium]